MMMMVKKSPMKRKNEQQRHLSFLSLLSLPQIKSAGGFVIIFVVVDAVDFCLRTRSTKFTKQMKLKSLCTHRAMEMLIYLFI